MDFLDFLIFKKVGLISQNDSDFFGKLLKVSRVLKSLKEGEKIINF